MEIENIERKAEIKKLLEQNEYLKEVIEKQ